MHYLERSCVPSPICLGHYQHGQNTWDEVSDIDRQEIQAALEMLQGRRCAYCECDLDQHRYHIEHFRQRSRYPQGTFDWKNLFWSCGQGDSCGKHKDGCGPYNHLDLIKPDEEDPEHFFVFVSNGSIALRHGLNIVEQHRAEETLRVFNLDAQWGRLRQMRKIAVSGYLKTMEEIRELSIVFPQQDIEAYIAQEFVYTQSLPFATAIKHALTLQG